MALLERHEQAARGCARAPHDETTRKPSQAIRRVACGSHADVLARSSRLGSEGAMEIVLYGLITFTVVFAGGLLGLLLGRLLPEQYHNDATQRIVQTATGMVSLIAALVLGLLVATAKGKFDTTYQLTEEFAAKLMLINRELVNFGPEAHDAQALLRK